MTFYMKLMTWVKPRPRNEFSTIFDEGISTADDTAAEVRLHSSHASTDIHTPIPKSSCSLHPAQSYLIKPKKVRKLKRKKIDR